MLLNVCGISVSFNRRKILNNLSLQVKSGEIVSLLGANASGKTTTLKAILGVAQVCKGKVLLENEDITNKPTYSIIGKGVAIVPENRRLFPRMTIKENLSIVNTPKIKNKTLNDYLTTFVDLFPVLSDTKRWKQMAGTLSGGEQQQVAMARALLLQPRLLLLDEPSMGMSVKLVKENFRIICQLARKGIGILMVEQNVKMALSIASHGYVLQEGRIIKTGTAKELLDSTIIQHSYLGEFV